MVTLIQTRLKGSGLCSNERGTVVIITTKRGYTPLYGAETSYKSTITENHTTSLTYLSEDVSP